MGSKDTSILHRVNVRRILICLDHGVQEVLDTLLFTGKKPTAEYITRLKASIRRFLDEHIGPALKYDLHVAPDDYRITPRDLYTLLRFNGFRVTREECEGKEEYTTRYGAYAMVKDEPVFRPVTPAENIELSFSITKEEE